MKCNKCGVENDIDAMFCEGCGADLKEAVVEKKCPSCNEFISEDSVFCENCGYDLKKEVKKEETKKCPSCNEVITLDSIFCENCGYDLTEKQAKIEKILEDKTEKVEIKEKKKLNKERNKVEEDNKKEEDLNFTKKVKYKKTKKTSRKPKVLLVSLTIIIVLLVIGFGTYFGLKILNEKKVINEKVNDTKLMNVYVFTFKDSVYGKEIIDYLNKDYSKKINVVIKDFFNKEDDLKLLEKLGKELEFETNKTPIIVVSDKYYIGAKDEIKTAIDLELKSVLLAKEYIDMISNIKKNKDILDLTKFN